MFCSVMTSDVFSFVIWTPIDDESIPAAVVDENGVIQFHDSVTKKVYDIIKVDTAWLIYTL